MQRTLWRSQVCCFFTWCREHSEDPRFAVSLLGAENTLKIPGLLFLYLVRRTLWRSQVCCFSTWCVEHSEDPRFAVSLLGAENTWRSQVCCFFTWCGEHLKLRVQTRTGYLNLTSASSSSAFPSYISGVHRLGWDFLPFFYPTIEVVTFRLRGWRMFGVFVAGIRPFRTWMSGSCFFWI